MEEQLREVVGLGEESLLQALKVASSANSITGGDGCRAEQVERVFLGVGVLETFSER